MQSVFPSASQLLSIYTDVLRTRTLARQMLHVQNSTFLEYKSTLGQSIEIFDSSIGSTRSPPGIMPVVSLF